MKEKLLFGVAHESERELKELLSVLKCYAPQTIGLELPENYLELRDEYFQIICFFDDLEKYFSDKKSKIIPLDRIEYRRTLAGINLAKRLKEEGHVKEDVHSMIRELKRSIQPHWPLEMIVQPLHSLILFQNTLEFMTLPIPELDYLWGFINAKREAHILKTIQEQQPELVIIGNAHAKIIQYALTSYLYQDFTT